MMAAGEVGLRLRSALGRVALATVFGLLKKVQDLRNLYFLLNQ
jgi:hypothetical protein